VLLWSLADDPRLPKEVRELLALPARNIFCSVASLWEIGIKHSTGRLQVSPREVIGAIDASRFQRLQILDQHIARVAELPFHHRDPFDRMLVAQAECEPLRLITSDRQLEAYGSVVQIV
jgi:PIN domain nuclease of toxin-antitoxin system